MRLLKDLWWLLLFYVVFLGSYEAWNTWNYWMTPKNTAAPSKIINITPGMKFSEVANLLESEGLIRSKTGFTILAWIKGMSGRLQAGEYQLSPAQSPDDILDYLVNGKVLKHVVTIPEGFNIYDIAGLIENAGIMPRNRFLDAAKDQALLKRLGIDGRTAEGYLFPDTYFFTKDTPPQKIIATMVERLKDVWRKHGLQERANALGVTMKEVLILASMVEKEAAIPSERPIIASVFWNRIKKGMPLQCDPTVYYGILDKLESESGTGKGPSLPTRLTKKDLHTKTPYNTYCIDGLPPGPIANPGLDSIKAVLYPEKTDFLYFVSKNDNTHYFSKTLAEHDKAVERYQIRKNDEGGV
ncbi:endolytic transglycosylase MltG [Dissulfurimicrobium hydrothermale]|uniref:endolytic transglycosylase MltG n=1 Tax=Dissulfurimicrobium hydrothermale TaxID=1750598 RepID=UPI001EDA932A|nr:endolytic transglycosylase MltG [Dissulfurimicrobium hydrothermale]UKL13616.1 endolytic transglycosylase MltG [Dissulfurimicrobium hydrothermale]